MSSTIKRGEVGHRSDELKSAENQAYAAELQQRRPCPNEDRSVCANWIRRFFVIVVVLVDAWRCVFETVALADLVRQAEKRKKKRKKRRRREKKRKRGAAARVLNRFLSVGGLAVITSKTDFSAPFEE